MSTPAPARPPVTRRSLAVVVAVLLVVALVLLVGGRLGGDQNPTAAPAPASQTTTAPATSGRSERDPESGLRWADLSSLPREVGSTVALIERGGPFPYAKDGATFGNRERILPRQRSGYYREYTVRTPGEGDRGARRVVTGDADREFFYTGDHYVSFVRIRR